MPQCNARPSPFPEAGIRPAEGRARPPRFTLKGAAFGMAGYFGSGPAGFAVGCIVQATILAVCYALLLRFVPVQPQSGADRA
ncbi:MAG: hypothetical protein ACT4QC_21830 [Planctomycetaceae bacterium]